MEVEDLRRTDALLRPIYCQHQGWFTYVNVLGQLRHPGASHDELEMLKKRFAWLAEQTAAMQRGEPLLRADGSTGAPEDLAKAHELARGVAAKLRAVAHAHGEALHRPIDDYDAAVMLAATNAWAAYAWEHLIKSTIAMAQAHGDSETADRTLQALPTAQTGTRDASVFVAALKRGGAPEVLSMLREQTAHLGGLMDAKAKEMDSLASG